MLPSASGFRARMSQLAGRLWEHAWLVEGDGGPTPQDEPLRAELFSAEQMERHGKRLAALHVLGAPRAPDRLLARLASNERVLVALGRQLAATADTERRFSPAAEWLLDNFYLIEEQIRTARRHLPRGYSRELPRLARSRTPPARRLPRVYDLALHAHRARRRPGRPRHADALRRRLPVGAAAAAGRAVGHPDHAAPGADREPAPRRVARRRPRRPSARRPAPGPTACSRWPRTRRAT